MAQINNGSVPVAITGLACRMPGEGSTLDRFWESICDGQSAWSPIPNDRFHPDAFAGNTAKGGHFLQEDISLFDAKFFNVSRDEARAMDPQQRLMLEVVYEALEAAGYPLSDIAGTKTGVFMGQFTDDYRDLVSRDAETSLPYSMTGLQRTSLSNRVSWLLDLRGPSFTVATACSSSLVALHLACQSLQVGESDMAIVGGCNLILSPNMFVYQSGQGFLSPDGKCKTFDAAADGYGRGEGFAVVVLKRVRDAVSHGDPVRAVIRGSGSNQDGHTKGFTLPNAEAQAELIQDVYRRAGLDYSQTSYVEAHGTGTKAGDLEETTALSRTIAAGLPPGRKLVVGSVKSNIGHLEAGAGLAAVVKSVLMLEKGLIPPNINLVNPNPALKLDEWNMEVPRTVIPWPIKGLRRISVNSFGYGGSNAHVVLDDAESYLAAEGLREETPHEAAANAMNVTHHINDHSINGHGQTETNDTFLTRPLLFTISAQDKAGIARVTESLAAHLVKVRETLPSQALQTVYLRHLAYTLTTRRSSLQWKTFTTAATLDELITSLSPSSTSPLPSPYLSSLVPSPILIFTGQGAQYPQMGSALLSQSATFRASIAAADRYLRERLGSPWSAAEELSRAASTSRVRTAALAQPLCTVLQVALVDMLRNEWGVVPRGAVGHSSGEMGAAYCAGLLSRENAWKVAYFRGVVAGKLEPGRGGMMAVGAGPEEVNRWIKKEEGGRFRGRAWIACENSPASVTVSGDADAVEQLEALWKAKGVFARRLRVDVAYHSPHMQAVAREYLEAIADVAPGPGIGKKTKEKTAAGADSGCVMYSSVTGQLVGDASELGAAYWVRNLISPVRFSTAVQNLVKASKGSAANVFVEVGPHPALQGPTTQSLQAIGVTDVQYLSPLKRDYDAKEAALGLAGSLFARGFPVNLAAVNQIQVLGMPRTLTDLPPYPWDHSRSHWAESRVTREYRLREPLQGSLLGASSPVLVAGERVWRGHLSLAKEPWIADHKIHGAILFPAAGFIAMAAEAALFSADAGKEVAQFRLRDMHLTTPLVLSENSSTEYSVCLRPHLTANKATSSEWMEFSISSSPDGSVLERNCNGLIAIEYRSQTSYSHAVGAHEKALELCKRPVEIETFYRRMASAGLQYGPVFKNLASVKTTLNRSFGSVRIPEIGLGSAGTGKSLVLHPAALDAVIHMAFAAVVHSLSQGQPMKAMVPKSIEEVVITTGFPKDHDARISGFSTISRQGYSEILANMTMRDDVGGQPVLKITGLCCAELAGAQMDEGSAAITRSICSKLVWRPALEHLDLDELGAFIQKAATVDTVTSSSTSKILSELINTIHHTKSDVSVVEFINTGAQPLLSTLNVAGALKTATYTIYVPDETTAEAVRGYVSATSGVVIEVKESKDSDNLEEESSTYDLVILSTETPLETADIENTTRMLAPGGHIFVTAPAEQTSNIEVCGRAAGVQGWVRIEGKVDGKNHFDTLLGHRRPETAVNGVNKGPSEAVILQSCDPSPAAADLANALAALLSASGYSASLRTWGTCDAAVLQGKTCISLVEIDRPVLSHVTKDEFEFIKGLIFGTHKVLWIGTFSETDPGSAIVTGLARVVRSEEPGIVFHTLQLNLHDNTGVPANLDKVSGLVLSVFQHPGRENEFRISDGVIEVSRVVEDDEFNADVLSSLGLPLRAHADEPVRQMPLQDAGSALKLCVRNAGLIDSLCFEPDPLSDTPLGKDEVEIDVKATSLNFRDVMTAMSQLPTTELGFDAAGIVRRSNSPSFHPGDRVAMCMPGAHRTVHRARASLFQSIPPSLSFADAATLPLAHCTAWYALARLARARAGQSVLIHVAAGGVGQAALQVAAHLGLEVYATAGSEAKRRLLMKEYGVREDHIFNSRDSGDFARGVKRMTGGKGVDIVLNSLSGEALRQSWYCVAPFGTFVEIGVRDILDNARLEMRPFLKEATFSFFDLRRMMLERPALMGEIMGEVFALLREGVLRPVRPIAVFPAGQVESAFRLMQSGQHVGKIVLSLEDAAQVVPVWRSPTSSSSSLAGTGASITLDSDAAYLLAGGLGGLGRSLARMLVDHGARKLCFLSRSDRTVSERPAARELIQQLQDRGVQVLVLACDVADESAVLEAVAKCVAQLGRVAGVIQCAMVLRDALFRNLTYTDWAESTGPKVHGTWNLHAALPDVDFFVSLASFTAIFGSRGVANYAAGSTYQDAVAHLRRTQGKHAVTLDLSIVRDAGVLAETGMTQALKDLAEPYGLDTQEVAELVWLAICGDITGQGPAQIVTGIATGGSAAAVTIGDGGFEPPWYLDDPRFAIMAQTGLRSTTKKNRSDKSSSAGGDDDVRSQLSRAKTMDEAAQAVLEALVDRVARMLQTTAGEIDTGRPLHSYGVDSLVAIEMSNWALRACAAQVAVFDLMAAVPIVTTARKIAASSSVTPKEIRLEAAFE
ncbi:PKS01 highly reducing polyketide synthase [Corynascus similis CBS 632.67]